MHPRALTGHHGTKRRTHITKSEVTSLFRVTSFDRLNKASWTLRGVGYSNANI